MSAILVLIGFSLAVAISFLIAFIWAVKSGQYDDRYTPSLRILFDEPSMKKTLSVETNNSMQAPPKGVIRTSDKNIKFIADDNKPQNNKSRTNIKNKTNN